MAHAVNHNAHGDHGDHVEEQATRLRAVAYQMLGSYDDADEAVREARRQSGATADTGEMTAVVARVCLAVLRSRESRREDPWDPWAAGEPGRPYRSEELAPATLTPAERVAFVLHDMFAVPVDDIAPIVERTPAATRQLVSRASTRVRGREEMPEPDLSRQREVVAALLTAARAGDSDALRALLDPDVLLRADAAAVRAGTTTAHGPRAVAERLADRARTARMARVDGAAGLVEAAPDGGLGSVIAFTVIEGRVTAVDVLMDPGHLGRLDVEVLGD